MYFRILIGGGEEPLTRFLPYIQFMLVGFVSQTLHFLVLALGSSVCAIAQSPVSATDQQRHQVSTGQVAQAELQFKMALAEQQPDGSLLFKELRNHDNFVLLFKTCTLLGDKATTMATPRNTIRLSF